MKLQNDKHAGNKEYSRWYVNLDKSEIDALGWKKGQGLYVHIDDGTATLIPHK